MHVCENSSVQSFFFVISSVFILLTVFVNGSTDACNSIATAVGSGSLKTKNAVGLSALLNMIGVLSGAILNNHVQHTLNELLAFIEKHNSCKVVFCILFSVVLWTVVAWYFAVPTSESHSLISAIAGASLLLSQKTSTVNSAWKTVLIGAVLSVVSGYISAYCMQKIFNKIKKFDYVTLRTHNAARLQIFFAALMSLLHGYQDGQKFIGLALCINQSANNNAVSTSSFRLVIALVMGIGTACGGGRIVRKIAFELTQLNSCSGLMADFVSSLVIFLSSVLGLPISTTQVKTAAVAGIGNANDGCVDKKTIKEILLIWGLTFPCCSLISFLMLRLLMCFRLL